MSGSFEEFFDRHDERRLLPAHQLLDYVDDQTIEWIIRPYGARVRAIGTERDFFDCIGLGDFPQDVATIRSNESIGPLAVEAARRSLKELEAEGIRLSRYQRGLCSRELKAAVQAAAIEEPTYCGLTTRLVRTIEGAVKQRNEEFAARVWGRTWADVFGEDVGLWTMLQTISAMSGQARPNRRHWMRLWRYCVPGSGRSRAARGRGGPL
jgi:hypothetical protein